ncbi:hypothetical protein BAOM_2255 [Peribacillus asahii]|uniref:Uncharacterized protein n=1 Tax=Peribacillus asahii TaxID=228899 RepID=A0A3T0KRK4_9BACI|nr:hypothetical protein [Peribacillus asahii]AZV42864.1 hypothetical protein BAOM_2255 [Peribacillus asahii]
MIITLTRFLIGILLGFIAAKFTNNVPMLILKSAMMLTPNYGGCHFANWMISDKGCLKLFYELSGLLSFYV